jgi:RimJ/RimL family protein N-acetyltransferase
MRGIALIHDEHHRPSVALRDVTTEDLPILFEHQLDEEATRMASFPSRDRDAFMAHWTKILADPACTALAIVAGDQVVGNLGSWHNQDGEREVGYWIGREFWGRGIATSALAKFLDAEKIRPLYAHVVEHNAASIRVLQKCGFSIVSEGRRSEIDDLAEVVLRLD